MFSLAGRSGILWLANLPLFLYLKYTMKNKLLILASIATAFLCWGVYGPILHMGQNAMKIDDRAILRPFVCVGIAYFLIGVIIPMILLRLRGEKGEWSTTGIIWSLAAGGVGALGALGLLLAFKFQGRPIFVIPLVFGGAPVVNSFVSIFLSKGNKRLNPLFSAGLIMVILGAVCVMVFKPAHGGPNQIDLGFFDILKQIICIGLTICCWGTYGPILHKGSMAMGHSRLRPFICIGLAYFLIAVILPNLLLPILGESSAYTFKGTTISIIAGSVGAIGALGVVMAFTFGGKPIYVMPLVFAVAPVVNTFWSIVANDSWSEIKSLFLSGLILVIAGAALVLIFAPHTQVAKAKAKEKPKETPKEEPKKEEAKTESKEGSE